MAEEIVAPIPGVVASVSAKVGIRVEAGEAVLTLQAMKMEVAVTAENGGTVREVLVGEGEEVEMGAVLVRLD